MVNNFEQIRNLLNFEQDGDCYYVQLLRRQSDDPHIDGKADPRYHGNMHSRSIKDYLVPSLDYFDKVMPDIITLCNTFNVRAYIRLNKRSFRSIGFEMLKLIADQAKSETFGSPYNLVASAAGQVSDAGKDKTWIVDLDEEYLPHERTMKEMIIQCEPYLRNIKPGDEESTIASMPVIHTKHGKHIIVKPFNMQTMTEKWNQFCKDNGVTMPLPRVFTDPENKYTTFELTDVYLNKAKDFESFLPEHETIKKNKNKISFKMNKLSDWDFHMLDFYWKGYCLKEQFWLKLCDIHKDNPTILYCP